MCGTRLPGESEGACECARSTVARGGGPARIAGRASSRSEGGGSGERGGARRRGLAGMGPACRPHPRVNRYCTFAQSTVNSASPGNVTVNEPLPLPLAPSGFITPFWPMPWM